jgi:hypothetical protein
MKHLRAPGLLLLATTFAGCGGDSTGPTDFDDLVGSWAAQHFLFTSVANPSHQLDLITHMGGAMDLVIHANGTFSGTIFLPDVTPFPLPIGGSLILDSDAGTLDVRFNQQTLSYGLFSDFVADFTLDASGNVLTWSFGETVFDFPQNPDVGEEAAVAVVVLGRT